MDINDYKDMFLAESREYLQALNESLLKLETEPDNRQLVQVMFRSAHSLKGMSAAMNYEDLTRLTHEMENILQELRDGSVSLTAQLADQLFQFLDMLEKLLARVENTELPPVDINPLLSGCARKIKAGAPAAESSELDGFQAEMVKEALNQGVNTYQVTIILQDNTILKSVRAYMAIQLMEEKGVLIKVDPSVADLENDNFGQSFTVYLQTAAGADEIRTCLENISEVKSVMAKPISVTQKEDNKSKAPINNAKQAEQRNDSAGKSVAQSVTAAAPKEKTVRVDISKLDQLINLVGELVINRTQIMEQVKAGSQAQLTEVILQLDRITSELQNTVMKLRMIPIKQVFDRFPRMVRDLSRESGKNIDFEIRGEDTELDRSLVNQIGDPLIHLLRNAIDHGLETAEERRTAGKTPAGKILLEARYEGGSIAVEVADDGRGLDAEKLIRIALEKNLISREEAGRLDEEGAFQLIFKNGFSTAEQVTEVSGRGVGMDAVKSLVDNMNGHIRIQSAKGAGTSITLRLPLTLAIIKALLVQAGGETYAVPAENIRENLLITQDEVKVLNKQKIITRQDEIIPLVSLEKSLTGMGGDVDWSDYVPVVIAQAGDRKAGLMVDNLLGQQEIVIKTFGNLLGQIRGIGGATVLGNGKVALIINAATLL